MITRRKSNFVFAKLSIELGYYVLVSYTRKFFNLLCEQEIWI